MPSPPLYTIQHLDLQEVIADPPAFLTPGRRHLIFWWQQIPLGHLFREIAQPVNFNEARKAVWNAVSPALAYYAKEQSVDFPELEKTFFSEDKPAVLSCFRQLFPSALQPDNDLPAVSLIICTRNRSVLLQKCLLALQLLTYPPSEVIVVDNAPEDDSTEKLVALYPWIHYRKEPQKGLDYARNCGIRAATSPLIAFTDDDVELHPDWVRQIAGGFRDASVQALTGLVFAKELDTKAQYYFEKYWSFNRGYIPLCFDTEFFRSHLKTGVPVWLVGAGACMAFRRNIFDAIGGFDTRLDMGAAGCNGDSEIWYRILAEGWNIRYDPLVIAHHTHRRDISAFKRQIYQYMRGFSAAALISYQRHRHSGMLYHLFNTLPRHQYIKLLVHPRRYGFKERRIFFVPEIKGYIAGIVYYLRHKKELPFEITADSPMPFLSLPENPLVSVIITTYNHARYLPESIQSVQQQTYTNIELIVVDDGSLDNTRELLQVYPGVKYIYQSNQGLAAARNKGIISSRGAFILFLDADDWLYPHAIVTQLRFFSLHPEMAFIAGAHDKVTSQKEILAFAEFTPPERDHYAALLQGNFIGMHAAVMYRKEIFDYFRYDIALKACEDYDFYLKIARRFKIYAHSLRIAAYRIHEQNMSADIPFMLLHARKALQKQRSGLLTQAEYSLYKKGLQGWKKYYTNELMYSINWWVDAGNYHKINTREWKLAVSGMSFSTAAMFIRLFLRKIKRKVKKILPPVLLGRLYRLGWIKEYLPRKGKVKWGDLKRTSPLSREFGYERGGPVDRYYIENFLENNAAVIKGCVLEIGDSVYTRRFGGDQVTRADILHVDKSNPDATIIGDLSDISHVDGDQFDCIILTQTLHLIYDFKEALQSCRRLLKRNGVLLLTVPGISNIDYGEWEKTWYWSFTAASMERLLAEVFGELTLKVQCFGNVMAAASFLYGLGKDEISAAEKDAYDPHYPLIIAASATKV